MAIWGDGLLIRDINLAELQVKINFTTTMHPLSVLSICVTIGQMYHLIMAHSGGDGYFMFIVHSRWIQVA